jgi:hypothetical protein
MRIGVGVRGNVQALYEHWSGETTTAAAGSLVLITTCTYNLDLPSHAMKPACCTLTEVSATTHISATQMNQAHDMAY